MSRLDTATTPASPAPVMPGLSLTALLQTAVQHHQAGRLAEAEALYREILATEPDHADALNLLGVLAHQTGRDDQAVELIGRAVLANPTNPRFYGNLGNVLQACGDSAAAIEMYQRALALDPADADAHNNLGNVLKSLGQLGAARAGYQQALALRPGFAEAHRNLGIVLQETNRLDDAVAHYRQALAFRPDYVEALASLGSVLREQGHSGEAESRFRRALELRPRDADAHAGLALVHIDLGRFAEAQQEIGMSLATAPEHPVAWATISATRKMTTADQPWLQTALKLVERARPRLLPREATKLWYAIGKYYDDTRQYDLAFAAYREANDRQRMLDGGADMAGFAAIVDALIAGYPGSKVRERRAAASTSERPVFVVGMPRSGTSLTEQIIASHPRAFGAGELHFWGRQFKTHPEAVLQGNLEDRLLTMLASEYDTLLQQRGGPAARVVDKMPNNFLWLGAMHTAFPHARIVHVRRHPVDTCLSIYFQNFRAAHAYGTDLAELVRYYREYLRIMAHWRAVLPADRLLEISYEDLITDQERWSRRLIEFIGLDWDERCLNFHDTERPVGTASNWQVRQKIYKTSKARWRNYQSHLGVLRELLSTEELASL
jgi:tetratricopeptide (TPR) repeat protein